MEVAGIPQLLPDQAAQRIDQGAVLVDVREPEEHAQARVPGSLFIPLRQIPERAAELPKDKPLILMCAGGVRSQQAATYLANEGFDVANLMHGINGWYRTGHIVDTSPA